MFRLTNGCNAFKETESPIRAEYLMSHGWSLVSEANAGTKDHQVKCDPAQRTKKRIVVGDTPAE